VLVAASTVNLVTDGYPGVRSRWLQPPLGLALVSVAAMIAVAAVDGRWVWLQAILAAGALVWLGWCIRYAGVAFLVAAFVGVAYVDVVAQWVSPLEEPVYLMPYAFAVLAVTVPMPGKHTWHFLTSAYPGTLLAGLITVALAVSLGTGTGDLAPVLAWSAVWFAAVFALRREDPWLYVSLASLVAAGWIAGFGWAAVANATAAATTALLADVRRDRISGEILPWAATGFLAAACGAFVQWRSWPPNTFVVVSIALGAALAGAAVVMWLIPDLDARWRRWKGPVTVLGQGALFTAAVVAGVAFDRPKASGVFGSILLIEAILLGSFATVRLDRSLAWASAVMVAFSAWLLAEASSARPETLVIGAVAIAAVLTATWAALFSSQPNAARLRMWTHPMLALAAAASVAAAALASAEIPPRSAAVAVAAMLTWHALVVGAAGTTRLDRFSVWAASAIATAAYGFWLRALEPSPAETVAMLAATAAFTGALGAWLMLRPPRFDPARLWIGSLNAWAGLSALAAIAVAHVTLPAQSASLIAAALSFGCAALLALQTRSDRSASRLPEASAAALIASVAFLVAGIDPESALFVTGLILLAATGVAAAIIGVGLQGIWQRPTLLVAVGFEIVTVTAAATLIGPTSEVTGYVLALAGAALAGYGIVGRDLRAVEAAIVTWAVSALILLNGRITLELHSIVLTISVATLAALEIERHRLRAEGREAPAGVGALEWALMAAPMTLAVVDAFGDLSYAVLLAAEGIALLVWGTVTQTRRRAFAGIGGIVTAIALAVVIPVVEGVRRGLAGETWLIIGAVAAVVLIAAGSMIEKRRERIGRRLAHVVEIVEGWQ